MGGVMIFKRDTGHVGGRLQERGHHVVYRADETNRCPGCGRAQWYVGRLTAECGFCGTAVALAEAKISGHGGKATQFPRGKQAGSPNRRRHERVAVENRSLQLLIDGSPLSFAIHNLSPGGLMGDDPAGLVAGTAVQVRFEGGILVPATVQWTDGALVGLAFQSPVVFEATPSG
jgi:hypothetical protein